MNARFILALCLTGAFLAGLLLSPFVLMWLSNRARRRAGDAWKSMSRTDFGERPLVPVALRGGEDLHAEEIGRG